jgi:hypothetical protein
MNLEARSKYSEQPDITEKPAERIFKSFFVAGISVLLSVEALWGAINLFLSEKTRIFRRLIIAGFWLTAMPWSSVLVACLSWALPNKLFRDLSEQLYGSQGWLMLPSRL